MNKKNKLKQTNDIPSKVKKGFRFYAAMVMAVAFILCSSVTAFAAGDPITVVNNLSVFIFGLIRAVGLILLGWLDVSSRPGQGTSVIVSLPLPSPSTDPTPKESAL